MLEVKSPTGVVVSRGEAEIFYPGAGHTLDFDPDRTRYLTDMLEWLKVRAASGSPRPAGGDH